MIGNTLIDVEDEAFGEVYFHAYHKVKSDTGFEDLIVAGRYRPLRASRWRLENGLSLRACRLESDHAH